MHLVVRKSSCAEILFLLNIWCCCPIILFVRKIKWKLAWYFLTWKVGLPSLDPNSQVKECCGYYVHVTVNFSYWNLCSNWLNPGQWPLYQRFISSVTNDRTSEENLQPCGETPESTASKFCFLGFPIQQTFFQRPWVLRVRFFLVI